MTALHEALAVIKGRGTTALRDETDIQRALQSGEFDGFQRTYTPLNDEGDQLPPESKNFPYTAENLLGMLRASMTPFLDISAQRDLTNCTAMADVVVGGRTILSGVPVTQLLFLEKQVGDLLTVVKSLPILDPAEQWMRDEQTGLWQSEPYITLKSTKILQNHEVAAATREHPAQVQVYNKDVTVGRWRNVKVSGAVPATQARAMLERATLLLEAVKQAREKANATTLDTSLRTGDKIFDYLFG